MSFVSIFVMILISYKVMFESILFRRKLHHLHVQLPDEVSNIYNDIEYEDFLGHERSMYLFKFIKNILGLLIIFMAIALGVFSNVDTWVTQITNNIVLQGFLFLAVFELIEFLMIIPIKWKFQFIIQKQYSLSNISSRIFLKDQLLGLIGLLSIGFVLVTALVWIGKYFGRYLFVGGILFVIVFMIVFNFIVAPLLSRSRNKYDSITNFKLIESINTIADSAGVELGGIYVYDHSIRDNYPRINVALKGRKHEISISDTALNLFSDDELIAAICHELGHVTNKHLHKKIILMISFSIFYIGFMQIVLNSNWIFEGFDIDSTNYGFAVLIIPYITIPLNYIVKIVNNIVNRKFELVADNYAINLGNGDELVSGLIKASKKSMVDLKPEKVYSLLNNSHPSLYERIINKNSACL